MIPAAVADRTFTPAEANSALDRVRPLAERMVALRARLAELEDEQREVVQIIAGNGSGYGVGDARTPEFAQLARELQDVLDELDAIGVQVKDADTRAARLPRRSATARRCCSAGGSARTRSSGGTAARTASPGAEAIDWDERTFWTRIARRGRRDRLAAVARQAVDARISRRNLDAAAATRYRVLRRSIFSAIVFVGVLSALLVIPQVRSIAGGILASSAPCSALVLGFAAQRTIGNFIAGLLIAFTPARAARRRGRDRRRPRRGRGDRRSPTRGCDRRTTTGS